MQGIASTQMELPIFANSVTLFTSNFHIQILLLILIFTNILCLQIADSSHSKFGNETDRLALLEFKAKIGNDPYGILTSWNDSFSFCKWQGVTCGRKHRRVRSLNLHGLSLSGTISPHVGNLTFLRVLNLRDNELLGEIPQEISLLFRLREINLTNNALEGEIPLNISNCSELKIFDLSNNHLVGKIPAELGSLKKLEWLRLFTNNLTGEIPHSLGNLSSLQLISIGCNNLKGKIPDELGKLTSLIFFGVPVNNLSGTLPPNLYNISSMIKLSVSVNQLTGSLPPTIGLTLPNLKLFLYGVNQFHGTIPTSLANASQLQVFDVSANFFSGHVPTNLGKLNNLQRFNLGHNFLGNNVSNGLSFVSALSNCSNLEKLFFDVNNFSGVLLPSSVANMSSLLALGLGTNQISGKIPENIGNLDKLYGLGLENNLFSGSIPTSLGKIQQLQVLYLHNNKLSGEIPLSLGNLTQLYELSLYKNRLEGTIPPTIGNCTNLHLVDLSKNNMTGTISHQIIGLSSLSMTLDLSQNSFSGPIPLEIGNLKNLVEMYLSENKFSGEIPQTIASCQSIEILNMQGNLLQGPIPSSLASLRGLKHLDLSRNKLSGKIPKEFEKLLFLQNLNLSFNNLSGEVPKGGVFSKVNSISLDGNDYLCGGISILQLPVCPVKQKKHKPNIAIIIALTLSSATLSVIISFFFLFYWRKARKSLPSTPFLVDSLPQISYNELLHATAGFSSDNLIGQGSFGSVYKGKLDRDGERLVAVKVLNLQQREASKSFLAECKALRNTRHRNLVKVLTYCSSIDFKGNDFKALVFDFMANGSLEMWLHPRENNGNDPPRSLNVLQRLQIAIDVASAVHYLHGNCQVPIIHCDLKPSNILLDDDMTAHVGDFGLARLLIETGTTSSQLSSIGMKGTIGYMAPEYGVGNAATTPGDTYSFGIILSEMFIGKRPTDEMFQNGLNLHDFVKTKLAGTVSQEGGRILAGTGDVGTSTSTNEDDDDRDMIHECHINIEGLGVEEVTVQKCIASVLEIGVACSTELPEDRMNMKDAVRKLTVIKDAFLRARNHHQRRKN